MIRTNITSFQDIPNVGQAIEKDFLRLGLKHPVDLVDKDPYQLYQKLCSITQQKHDPCVVDVFIAAIKYMQGEPARKWWEFTAERKQHMSG